MKKVWDCQIGYAEDNDLPPGSDYPMRLAVERAFIEITGYAPEFIFSGWGGKLTKIQEEIIEEWKSMICSFEWDDPRKKKVPEFGDYELNTIHVCNKIKGHKDVDHTCNCGTSINRLLATPKTH